MKFSVQLFEAYASIIIFFSSGVKPRSTTATLLRLKVKFYFLIELDSIKKYSLLFYCESYNNSFF